jgi:hypothetical protein
MTGCSVKKPRDKFTFTFKNLTDAFPERNGLKQGDALQHFAVECAVNKV